MQEVERKKNMTTYKRAKQSQMKYSKQEIKKNATT